MAWFALARLLFVAAVAYAAADLQPLPIGLAAHVAFALVLAALVVLFDSRLRETADQLCTALRRAFASDQEELRRLRADKASLDAQVAQLRAGWGRAVRTALHWAREEGT